MTDPGSHKVHVHVANIPAADDTALLLMHHRPALVRWTDENRAIYEAWKEAHGILNQGARVPKNVAAAGEEQHVAPLVEDQDQTDAVDTKRQTLRETLRAAGKTVQEIPEFKPKNIHETSTKEATPKAHDRGQQRKVWHDVITMEVPENAAPRAKYDPARDLKIEAWGSLKFNKTPSTQAAPAAAARVVEKFDSTPRLRVDQEEFRRDVERMGLKTLKDSRWAK